MMCAVDIHISRFFIEGITSDRLRKYLSKTFYTSLLSLLVLSLLLLLVLLPCNENFLSFSRAANMELSLVSSAITLAGSGK